MIDWLVWSMDDMSLNSEDTSPSFFLSATECQAYAGFRMEKRRREWLLGRWTAKQLLRCSRPAYADILLSAIAVDNDADGAPYFALVTSSNPRQRLSTCLSISHRGEKAFCALSDSYSIGADIECVEARHPAFVHDFFTEDENAHIWSQQTTVRDIAIAVMWSVKESVLKALRQGLRVDTRRVEIIHINGLEPDIPVPGNDRPIDGWYAVQVRCALPGAARFVAWWRPEDTDVLTVAAALPDTETIPVTSAILRACIEPKFRVKYISSTERQKSRIEEFDASR